MILHELKNEKKLVRGFSYLLLKYDKFLSIFSRALRWAETPYFWRVVLSTQVRVVWHLMLSFSTSPPWNFFMTYFYKLSLFQAPPAYAGSSTSSSTSPTTTSTCSRTLACWATFARRESRNALLNTSYCSFLIVFSNLKNWSQR